MYEQLSDSLGIVAAGLPNIYGTVGAWIRMFGGSGAFSTPTQINAPNVGMQSNATVENNNSLSTFDAKRCSAIYKDEYSTVTPPSVLRIVQMKY